MSCCGNAAGCWNSALAWVGWNAGLNGKQIAGKTLTTSTWRKTSGPGSCRCQQIVVGDKTLKSRLGIVQDG